MKNKVRQQICELVIATYVEKPLEDYFEDWQKQIDRAIKEWRKSGFNWEEPVVVFEGGVYETEAKVFAVRDKTEKELEREKEAAKKARAKRVKAKAEAEAKERKLYERLKKRYESGGS